MEGVYLKRHCFMELFEVIYYTPFAGPDFDCAGPQAHPLIIPYKISYLDKNY